MIDKGTTLVWLQRDLRIRDNPALTHAAAFGPILPVYILDPDYTPGAAGRWWLHHSLERLAAALSGHLILRKGDPVAELSTLIDASNIKRVVWNRLYEPARRALYQRLEQALASKGVATASFNASLLWEPDKVHKQDGTPYKVFTPYYKKGCLNQPPPRYPTTRPQLRFAPVPADGLRLDGLNLLPAIPWHSGFTRVWQPGEAGASERLSSFIEQHLTEYKTERDIPSATATSGLSAHLHFGEISPQQIWYAAKHAFEHTADNPGLETFLSELGWREFCHYQLYHNTALAEKNVNSSFDAFPWRTDQDALQAWQRGQTGIPMVDAGMRELWQTGTMHNRVRMLVASFLVKNLLIHWREGASWFMDCLLDGDLAANSANWQWVAGCGADAAPYFRIFNPVLQGQKFDPQGEYVSRHCPELRGLPAKYIHAPWTAPEQVLKDAGVTLGQNYPRPMVDIKASRQRALDALAKMKESAPVVSPASAGT